MDRQNRSTVSTSSPSLDVHFGLMWALVNAVGFVVGSVALYAAVPAASIPAQDLVARPLGSTAPLFYSPAQVLLIALVVAVCFLPGAVIGVAQWFLLRRQVPRAGWWILATSTGLALALIALTVLFALETTLPRPRTLEAVLPYRLVGLGIGGALFGVVQWLWLRRRLCRAWICIPTMTLACPPLIISFILIWECAAPPMPGCPEWSTNSICLGPILGMLFFILVTSVVMAYLMAPNNRRGAGR